MCYNIDIDLWEAIMKCPNCGRSEFEQMPLYEIYCTEGGAQQLVQSYICLHCGRVELFMPQDLIKKRLEKKRLAEEQRQAAENRKREEERLRNRMQELETFLQDENHTLKELKEAQRELTEIQDKLHIRIRQVYFKL